MKLGKRTQVPTFFALVTRRIALLILFPQSSTFMTGPKILQTHLSFSAIDGIGGRSRRTVVLGVLG